MRAPLKDDDIQLGPATLCLGSGAHPRGISADDDQSFLGHFILLAQFAAQAPEYHR